MDVVALGELLIDFTENGVSSQGNPGADMMLTEEQLPEEIIRGAKIFHFGTLSMTHPGVRAATKKAIAVAKEAGALISFDPNIRKPLWDSMEDAREQVLYGLGQCDILKIRFNTKWQRQSGDYS